MHDASVLNPLFGAAPLEVTAMATVQVAWNNSAAADSVMSVLRYPDGSTGTDQLAFADDSFKIAACSYHEILGDQGAIIIRDAMNQDTAGAVELHTADGTTPSRRQLRRRDPHGPGFPGQRHHPKGAVRHRSGAVSVLADHDLDLLATDLNCPDPRHCSRRFPGALEPSWHP